MVEVRKVRCVELGAKRSQTNGCVVGSYDGCQVDGAVAHDVITCRRFNLASCIRVCVKTVVRLCAAVWEVERLRDVA